MKFRFDSIAENTPILTKASLLDPRYKKTYISKALTVTEALKDISSEMKMNERAGPSQEINFKDENNINRDKVDDDLWNYRDTIILKTVPHPDEPGGIPAELRNYLSQKLISRKENPLNYWEEAKHAFPNVYRVAKRYLSIPATSVPCERLFSRAGIIDSNFRSRLNLERLSRLVFLSSVEEKDWEF